MMRVATDCTRPADSFGRDLLPQHRADLVAVQPVQDASGLLRVDQVVVQVAGIFGGRADGRLGDLVEHHPLDRDAGLQRLQQVPGDGLALAVTVSGQIELVDVFEQALELGDGALLLGADDVERLEVVIDVDAEPGPRLGLVLRRHVGGGPRQVADVPAGRLDDVVGAQVTGDFARLGGRLDDDEPPNAAVSAAVTAASAGPVVSQLRLRSTSVLPTGTPDPRATDNFAPWTGQRKPTPLPRGHIGRQILGHADNASIIVGRFPHVLYQAR